jgi:hypothetical protein
LIARYVTLLALLFGCVAQSSVGDDDPLLNISYSGVEGTGYKYVWAIRQSRLATLPHCDPATAEVPVSPHQAIVAATEFMRMQFPPSSHLTPSSLVLLARGIEKNSVASQLWMYEIWFLPDSLPPQPEQALLTVTVLMDGKVVVPVKQPVK